jgi:hypothetical protein
VCTALAVVVHTDRFMTGYAAEIQYPVSRHLWLL